MGDHDSDIQELYFDLNNGAPDLESFKLDKRFVNENLTPDEMYDRYLEIFKYLSEVR
jgi:hypothetical protein